MIPDAAGAATWAFNDLGAAGSMWTCSSPAVLNVVFVHGFIGDHLKTWSYQGKKPGLLGKRPPPIRFVDLLTEDGELPPCNYFSIAHEAGITSTTGLREAAGLIRTYIKDYVPGQAPIALIAHSFGGLASRRAILDMLGAGEGERILSLLMLGTPNSGAQIALAAKALGSSSAGDMSPFNDDLADLNRDWLRLVVNEGDPAVAAAERAQLMCWSVIGTEDRVVTPASAAAYAVFADTQTLNKSHTGLCKPRDRQDHSYRVVKRFLQRSMDRATTRTAERAVRELTYRLRRASLAGRWVTEEAEHITLEQASGSRLRCRIRNVREGGIAKAEFHFLVWLPGQWPADEEVDYDWEVGRGVLDGGDFATISASLGEDLDDFFKVVKLRISQAGRTGDFHEIDRHGEAGWVKVVFAAPEWVAAGQRYDELQIELQSYVDRGQGWYFYGSPRTVARRLEVKLTAPFEARPIASLGAGTRVQPTTRIGPNFLHTVTVDGAVAMDRNLIWVFPPDAGGTTPAAGGT